MCGPYIEPTRIEWWNRQIVCTDEASGIRPKFDPSERRYDCCTPISQYMAVHGELARKLITRELCVPRSVNGPPPCNVCEYCIPPPCRDCYRKHECVKPEESDRNFYSRKVLRDRVENYWNPVRPKDAQYEKKLADLAGNNVGLLTRLIKRNNRLQCL